MLRLHDVSASYRGLKALQGVDLKTGEKREHQFQRLETIGIAAPGVGAQPQIVLHRQARKQPPSLRHQADSHARDEMGRHPRQVLSLQDRSHLWW